MLKKVTRSLRIVIVIVPSKIWACAKLPKWVWEKCEFAQNTCLSLPISAKILLKCIKEFAQI